MPTVVEYRAAWAKHLRNRGAAQSARGRAGDAEAGWREAVNQLERVAADASDRPAYRAELAGVLNNLGASRRDHGGHSEARECHARAVRVCEALCAVAPTIEGFRTGLARSCVLLGKALLAADHGDAARPHFERAAQLLRPQAEQHPPNPQARLLLGEALSRLDRHD